MTDDFAYPVPWVVQRADPPSSGKPGFLALWSDADDYGVAVYARTAEEKIYQVTVKHFGLSLYGPWEIAIAVDWSREDLRDSLMPGGRIAEIIRRERCGGV